MGLFAGFAPQTWAANKTRERENSDLAKVEATKLKRCPLCGCEALRGGGGTSRHGPVPYMTMCASRLCGIKVEGWTRAETDAKWERRYIEPAV